MISESVSCMWNTSGSKEKYQINGLICQTEPGTSTLWPIFKGEGLQKWVSGLWTGLILKWFVNLNFFHPWGKQVVGSLLLTGTHLIHKHAVEKEYISSEWILYPTLTTELNGTFGGRGNVSLALLLVFIARWSVYFASHQHAILVEHNIKLHLIKHDYHTVFVPV